MKEQITIYYSKDQRNKNDYIVKRVLTQEGKIYKLKSYYMINGKLREYPSKTIFTRYYINKYVLECMKESCFDHIEYQNVMEGI